MPVTKVLHLKSAVTALPDGTVIGYEPLVDDPRAFDRFLPMPEESGAHVVDLGGGRLLLAADAPRSAARLDDLGYEPVAEMSEQARQLLQACEVPARLLTTPADLRNLRCDRIVCMEVFEHLDSPRLARAFADLRELLRPDGQLVLSVPVEIGAAALVKNVVRAVAGQQNDNASWRNIAAAMIGRTAGIVRHSDAGYIHAHLGFDYRALRAQVRDEGFSIETERFAPFPLLGAALNSQVFWRCIRR